MTVFLNPMQRLNILYCVCEDQNASCLIDERNQTSTTGVLEFLLSLTDERYCLADCCSVTIDTIKLLDANTPLEETRDSFFGGEGGLLKPAAPHFCP